jgi:triphosphoribosyl-dephospho-CoA synthase
MLPIGLCAQAACILEVSARKPGNVHRFADFDDLTYLDFVLSAAAIAPVLDTATGRSIGATILQSIRVTRTVVATNSNLGIVLLLAPLAAVPREQELRIGVKSVLDRLSQYDADFAYEAIRLARPGGLGTVAHQDVQSEPTESLRAVMALAADRDLIARQYANGFREVLDEGLPALLAAQDRGDALEDAIIHCHLTLMAKHPDSLIARKYGPAEAEEVRSQAQVVLELGGPATDAGRAALADFDRWLRANRRNPGTTADLVCACLFAALRDGTIQLPTGFVSDFLPLTSDLRP